MSVLKESMAAGKFIVLEGIDGAGTTTQARKIADFLFEKNKNNTILLTREPYKSQFGLRVKELLKHDKDPKANARLYAQLFVEDRKFHLTNVILPALREGITVICDRYMLSTLAYQHWQGIELNLLVEAHQGMPLPDLTLFLDAPPELAFRRRAATGAALDVFEEAGFQEGLKKAYYEAMKSYTGRLAIIDSALEIKDVFEQVKQEVGRIIE